MQKKKFDLTADLINLSEESTVNVSADQNIENNRKINNSVKNKTVSLTVSVEENFHAEFKSWCARHRLKMNEAITKGFQLLKEKNGA